MKSEQVLSISVALLVPVVAGVVGAAAIAFQDWRVRRSLAGRRKLAFDDATRQVTFAGEWWKTTGNLLDPSSEALREARARASAWLNEASALVAYVEALPLQERVPVPVIRRLLLLYPLRRRPATLVRVAYFISLGWWTLVIGDMITTALIEPENIGAWMFVVLISPAVCALVLRTVAVSVDGAEHAPGGALLLRRLHRRPAVAVQLLFFISLVWAFVQATVVINEIAYFPRGTPDELAQLIVLVAVAIGLRSWALWIESTGPEDSQEG